VLELWQSGKQRPSTQCSPLLQERVLEHSLGLTRQKPPWQRSPEPQSVSPVQIGVQALFTHALPGAQSRSSWQV